MPDETPDPSDSGTPGVDGDDGQSQDPLERPDTPPEAVVDEAERLTRLARDARVAAKPPRYEEAGEAGLPDEAETDAYLTNRDELLADHDYTARVREDETRDVLVVHPAEWVEDGTVQPARIEDVDRGIEVPLSGPGEGDEWALVDDHNREIVEDVREEYGDTHAANVAALADFAGNHYAKPIESTTEDELREFLNDYFVRNAWPTDEQRAVVKKSVRVAFEVADERCPLE